MTLQDIKPGDTVRRFFGPYGPDVIFKVTEVDEKYIYCGKKDFGWKFLRSNGGEVDEDLHWDGGIERPTGSYIKPEQQAKENMPTNEERGEVLAEDEAALVSDTNAGQTLLNRLSDYVNRFEKANPNPAVRAQHKEYFLLKECLGVVEAMVEFIDEEY
jgi:hypothetical protein